MISSIVGGGLGSDRDFYKVQATTTATGSLPGRKPVELVPALLKERIEQFGIVMPSGAPVFDRVVIWPLTDAYTDEKTSGGIIVPGVTRGKLAAQMGVVIRAGAKALEQLHSHGIELGHIVMIARMSPWTRHYMANGEPHHVFVLRAAEIVWSDDLQVALEAGDLSYQADHNGNITLNDRERVDPPAFDDEGT